tara:strand:- start:1530 stop:4373 length:2844 start_codon:yes stop_codon:yes gene_type:complete
VAWTLVQDDDRLDDELEFAKGLASRYSFVDLADLVLAGASDLASGPTAEHRLSIARCELSAIGASGESDPTKRRELFEQALSCYESFVAANGGSAVRGEAEAGLVAASVAFGQYLERDLEDAVGDARDELKGRQAEILTRAVELTEDLVGGFRVLTDRSAEQTVQFLSLLFQRGQMLATIARSQEGTFFADQAIEAFIELANEAGFDSIAAMYAFRGIGDVYAAQGNWGEAAGYYDAVIQNSVPLDRAEWEQKKEDYGLGAAEVQTFFEIMTIALPGLTKAYVSTDQTDKAVQYSIHLINVLRTEGANLDRDGYEALLSAARMLIQVGGYVGGDFGDWQGKWYATEEEMKEEVRNRRMHNDAITVAMEIANQVNDENQGEWLQILAQKLISDISTMPGMTLEPIMVLDAAQGELYSGNENLALEMLRGVLTTLQSADDATKLELGARTLNLMGTAYKKTDRDWEAAFAFEAAVREFGGDEEMDAKNAKSFLSAITQIKRKAGDEATDYNDILALERAAENLVQQNPGASGAGEDGIHWNRAQRAYAKGDYEGARREYIQVSNEYTNYEMAVVLGATCLYYIDKFEDALGELQNYLTVIVPDPANASDSPSRQQVRDTAIGLATYFVGLCHYNGTQDWAATIATLKGYETKFGDAPDERRNLAMDLVVRAKIELNDLKGMLASFDAMQKAFPGTSITNDRAQNVYIQLAKEYEGTAKQETLRLMADLLALSTGGTAKPDYAALRNLSRHWADLGEFKNSEKVLLRIIDLYGDDPKIGDQVRQRVLPDLGHIYLAQRDVQKAKATLDPLVLDDDNRPTRAVLNDWSRALTGWIEMENGRLIEIPGASGSADDFQLAVDKLDALSRSRTLTKWVDCSWFEIKFRVAFTYYAWSRIDSSKLSSVQSQLSQITTNFCEDWSCINNCELPTDDEGDAATADDLKRWFQWLASR